MSGLRLVGEVHRRLLGGGTGPGDAGVVGDHVLLGVGLQALVRLHQPAGPRLLLLELRTPARRCRRPPRPATAATSGSSSASVASRASGSSSKSGSSSVSRALPQDLVDRVAELPLEHVRLVLGQPPVQRLALAHLGERVAVVGAVAAAGRPAPSSCRTRRRSGLLSLSSSSIGSRTSLSSSVDSSSMIHDRVLRVAARFHRARIHAHVSALLARSASRRRVSDASRWSPGVASPAGRCSKPRAAGRPPPGPARRSGRPCHPG